MANIEAILNDPRALEIFWQYRINETGMNGLRQGFTENGALFMSDLVGSVTPGSVLNGNWMTPRDTESIVNQLNEAGNPAGRRSWEDWLKVIGETGETISTFRDNILGNNKKETPEETAAKETKKKNNTIIFVVAGVILLVVAVLLIRKPAL